MKKRSLLLLALMLLALSACAAFPGQRARTQVRVLLAGSLVVPFDELERADRLPGPVAAALRSATEAVAAAARLDDR